MIISKYSRKTHRHQTCVDAKEDQNCAGYSFSEETGQMTVTISARDDKYTWNVQFPLSVVIAAASFGLACARDDFKHMNDLLRENLKRDSDPKPE